MNLTGTLDAWSEIKAAGNDAFSSALTPLTVFTTSSSRRSNPRREPAEAEEAPRGCRSVMKLRQSEALASRHVAEATASAA
jgi:hypothetical protein